MCRRFLNKELVGITIGIIGAISLIYGRTRPYSEPIITVGKTIDKYETKGSNNEIRLSNFGCCTFYYIPDSFNLLVFMENGDKNSFRISKEKYDVLEIDDSARALTTSCSRPAVAGAGNACLSQVYLNTQLMSHFLISVTNGDLRNLCFIRDLSLGSMLIT